MGRTRLKLHGESFEEQTALSGAHSITGEQRGSRKFRAERAGATAQAAFRTVQLPPLLRILNTERQDIVQGADSGAVCSLGQLDAG